MAASFSRWTKVLLLVGFNLLLLSLLAAAGEVALRGKYQKIERITGVSEWKYSSWRDLTYFWDRYHKVLGWTNQPDYHSDGRVPFKVTINAQGIRGQQEYTPSPAPGTRRIVLLGDSITFGEEVDDDQTIPHHLQRALAGSEVINFGVHGYGMGQMVLRLERDALPFSPHQAVMVIYLPNMVLRIVKETLAHNKPVFHMQDGKLALRNVPVPEASRQPWLFRHSFTAAWLFGRPKQYAMIKHVQSYNRLAVALVNRARAACQRAGAKLTVVALHGGSHLQGKSERGITVISTHMRRALAKAGVDYLDLTRTQAVAYEQHGDRLLAPNKHFSDLGNRLWAEAIARHLGPQP